MKKFFPIALIILSLCIGGCATTGKTPAEKRKIIQDMKNDVLAELYKQKPDVKQQIEHAPGYAVFSNLNVNVIFASFGGGYGVVKNNETDKYTYMKMGEVGVGLGIGAKDFRAVLVFHNTFTLDQFIAKGWAFGAQTDAAAKSTDKGGAVGGEISANAITIYQLTETGLSLQATIKGTKFWKDDFLN